MNRRKLASKILAVLFVFAAVFSLPHAAAADDSVTSVNAAVTLKKQIVFKNPDNEQVRLPNIDLTYSIRAASPDESTTVTDISGNTVTIRPGVIDAVSAEDRTQTISLTDSTYANTSAAGTAADVGEITFAFSDPAKFTQPGVYRYIISDTTSKAALAAAGIDRDDDYVDSRSLDVYVRRDADTSEAEIYGYVLTESAAADETLSVTESSEKSDGFVYDVSGDAEMKDVDVYQTYNISVEKAVSGALADTSHKFPFTVTLANSAETGVRKLDVRTNGFQADLGAVTEDNENGTAYIAGDGEYVTGGIAGGGMLTITGIPKSTVIGVKEQNDTYDEYTASAEIDAVTAALNSGASSVKLAKDEWAELDDNINAAEISTVRFTNRLDEISPTGLVLRTAPYVLLMTAGVLLAVIFMKRKSKG